MEIIIYVLITIIILFLLYKIINASESIEGWNGAPLTLKNSIKLQSTVNSGWDEDDEKKWWDDDDLGYEGGDDWIVI